MITERLSYYIREKIKFSCNSTNTGTITRVILILVALLSLLFGGYIREKSCIERLVDIKLESTIRIGEIKQLPDDLTKMARMYLVTENEEFKKKFYDLVSIFRGELPRPRNYNYVNWEIAVDLEQARDYGKPESLIDHLKRYCKTQVELDKLSEANVLISELIRLESEAIDNKEQVKLFNESYTDIKADVLQSVYSLYSLIDSRTTADIDRAQFFSRVLLFDLVLNILILVGAIYYNFCVITKFLGTSFSELETHIKLLANTTIPIEDLNAYKNKGTLLGWIYDNEKSRRLSEENLEIASNTDALTGLPNRKKIDDLLSHLIRISSRTSSNIGLVFLDLDHFKLINSSLGHHVGDDVIVELSRRIKSTIRIGDSLTRFGGDEFIILLPNTDEHHAIFIANRILECVRVPFSINNYTLQLTASIGIAVYPKDGDTVEKLSSSADMALYKAKTDGRNCFRFFTRELQEHSLSVLNIVNNLKYAIDNEEFELYYQPQIDIKTGNIVGVEALIRWNSRELGRVSPGDFIPVAEESGLILPIGAWVLQTAIKQAKRWSTTYPNLQIVVSINLSATQFLRSDLIDTIMGAISSETLPINLIELELTERISMFGSNVIITILDKLYSERINISIDDFGTGYSSLIYLKQFKICRLKIDQAFIRDICDHRDDLAIVQSIIGMANGLNIKTTAEGVETLDQLRILAEHGCDSAQGYYIARPLPVSDFEQFMTNYRAIPIHERH